MAFCHLKRENKYVGLDTRLQSLFKEIAFTFLQPFIFRSQKRLTLTHTHTRILHKNSYAFAYSKACKFGKSLGILICLTLDAAHQANNVEITSLHPNYHTQIGI